MTETTLINVTNRLNIILETGERSEDDLTREHYKSKFSHSGWDGSSKSFTKLCHGCEFYRRINDKYRCYGGMAYKIMDRTKVLSYCKLIKKPSPRKEMLKSKIESKKTLVTIS